MAYKRQPLDKTVVTEFNVHVADIHIRQKQFKAAIAAMIPRDSGLKSGDTNITDVLSLELEEIHSVLIINSWENFLLELENQGSSVVVPCTGLFIHYGALDKIVVRKALVDTRITYLCA